MLFELLTIPKEAYASMLGYILQLFCVFVNITA